MQTGLYDHLLTVGLQEQLSLVSNPDCIQCAPVDAEDAHSAIAQLLEHALVRCLASYRGLEGAARQKQLVDRLIATLTDQMGGDFSAQSNLVEPLQRLLAVHEAPPAVDNVRPDTPLARSALMTGSTHDPALHLQLAKEIVSSDRVDVLCSFIKWSGLRLLIESFEKLANRPGASGPRIRIITTSYMGATDPRAIEELSRLPNTEIRVSYDTKRTRLHAKSYLFHRETGFGSAYIGSANISHAALSEGLEWTTKISQYELPYLWNRITATFESYWQADEFQRYSGSQPERLRQAIACERAGSGDSAVPLMFDLRPFPFQEEILDILAAEREHQKKFKHLVVAATGTGKTMIAAFDYSRFARKLPTRPTLLFIAHREEILQQAMGAFRAVLRDNNFGDLLTGGQNPNQEEYLFCTIQSYQSRELYAKDERYYDYVIVDEFHHAAAPSYQRLLKHVKPQVLLGLTATPERTDQLDILSWFGGQASAEIRLPDAINRRLLCPFQYFGVTDSVDLDNLTWQRGGYRRDELDKIYTGNDIRAGGIVAKVQEILLNPALARGLGFCVSIAHAEFMAHFFNNHGLAAACLTGNSPDEERRSVQARLSRRSINFLFVVDLYNEGVDLPEIDTVLFLRPTESLTIFLQQMGRGLRLHPDKDCLTILDFIGAQRREYRFAERFRALSSNPAKRLDKEIEHGFPNLPSGCSIRLERVAQKYILENIRNSIRKSRLKLVADIKELARYYGRTPTISEVLEYLDMSLDALLKRYLWSDLLADAGLIDPVNDSDQDRLTKGLHRISHIDDFERIRYLLDYMRGDGVNNIDSAKESPFLVMLQVALWGKSGIDWSLAESENRLRLNRSAWSDLQVILQYKLSMAPVLEYGQLPSVSGPLTIHAHYTRDEILVALGHWSLDRRPEHREGVLHIKHSRVDAFFVTLQKTEADYSPTTMYEDYLVSHNLFHWQSQSNTSAESNTGQRYIHHEAMGYTPLMFVREHNDLPSGLSAPYAYLGPCQYVSHQGSRPMSIIWKLRHPVPARLFRVMARQIIA